MLRACPVCRVISHFVVPSQVFVDSPLEKKGLVEEYQSNMKRIPCRQATSSSFIPPEGVLSTPCVCVCLGISIMATESVLSGQAASTCIRPLAKCESSASEITMRVQYRDGTSETHKLRYVGQGLGEGEVARLFVCYDTALI